MYRAAFKDSQMALRFGLSEKDQGIVTANETRDGEGYVTIQFDKVEINGLPAELFDLIEDVVK
jgi:hypothetical protein